MINTNSTDKIAGQGKNRIGLATALQHQASDPQASVWVSANAGSGKTHVLVQRIIRLMLEGVAPNRILALTYTKAAAANMATRVFDTLAQWVGLHHTIRSGHLASGTPIICPRGGNAGGPEDPDHPCLL